MQGSETKIRYAVALLLALTILVVCSRLSVTEGAIDRVEATNVPAVPPPSQVYVVTKVLGMQEGDADAATMEVTFAEALEREFAAVGEPGRVQRSYKKYEETLSCKNKTCDIVAIKEHNRNYELHVICPNHPTVRRSGALEEIPCVENVARRLCRKQALVDSVKTIKAHDTVFHPRRSR